MLNSWHASLGTKKGAPERMCDLENESAALAGTVLSSLRRQVPWFCAQSSQRCCVDGRRRIHRFKQGSSTLPRRESDGAIPDTALQARGGGTGGAYGRSVSKGPDSAYTLEWRDDRKSLAWARRSSEAQEKRSRLSANVIMHDNRVPEQTKVVHPSTRQRRTFAL